MRWWIPLALAIAGCRGAPAAGDARETLLAADRGAAGLESVLAEDAYYLAPGLPGIEGREAIVQELADAGGEESRLPLVAGVSGDGTHGYTAGRVTGTGADADSSARHGKYLAYWRREPAGWRLWAIVVNGSPAAPDVAPPPSPMPPARSGRAPADPGSADQLRAADAAFSDRAASAGVGPGFREFAEPGALLLGGPRSGMVWGDSAIGEWLAAAIPPRDGLTWAPRIAHLAPSGDLGFTIGDAIYRHLPAEGGEQLSYTKYLTIWRRQPDGRWAYAADGGNDQPFPGDRAGLRVRSSSRGLRLVNPDTADAFYLAFEQGTTALVNWRPCVEGADCRRVPPGGERRVPFDSVPGWNGSADSITVFWWRRAADSSRGLAFDSVRSVTVGAR